MAAFTFFTNPMSRGQIARWALQEVDADYETVIVDWESKPAALIEANPMGKVPTLIHHAAGGDRTISEAAAICHYLAEMHPQAGLLPKDSEKADYFRWIFFAAGPVEAATAAKALGFDPTDARQKMMAGWGDFEWMIGALDGWFAAHDYVCGDRFTMADVYVGSEVDWGLTFDTMPETRALRAYVERCRAREAYQTAKAIDNALIAEMQED